MKPLCSAVVLLALAAAGAAAPAQAGSRTRAEVLHELAEARRMGDIVAAGCGGGTLREQFPHRYAAPDAAAARPGAADARRAEGSAARERESPQSAVPDAQGPGTAR